MNNAIEKNRRALLRLVRCWLALAYVVRLTRHILPPRVSRYVDWSIFKVEAATGLIVLALIKQGALSSASDQHYMRMARLYQAGLCGYYDEYAQSIEFAIERLRAVRIMLRGLKQRIANCAAQGCALGQWQQTTPAFVRYAAAIACSVCPKQVRWLVPP